MHSHATCLVPMLLANEGTVLACDLGGCGGSALRIGRKRVQAAVHCECPIVLDGGIQRNMARAGRLGCSVSVAREGSLTELTNPLTRSSVSANALGRLDLGSSDVSLRLASVGLPRICFTRMKSFFTSTCHDFVR